MTAEQFIKQEYGEGFFYPEPEDIFQYMTMYAKLMCDKQKQICAEEAETKDDSYPNSYETYYVIDKNSILNSPYPEGI